MLTNSVCTAIEWLVPLVSKTLFKNTKVNRTGITSIAFKSVFYVACHVEELQGVYSAS